MRKFILIPFLLLISCNNILVSELEEQAVESVLDFYGGVCYRSKGFNSKNGETKTYFELKMTESEVIESQMNKVYLPSSNIAYLFYKNLKEEKNNYDEVHVVLISQDKSEQEFVFPISLLEKVEKRMSVAEKTVEILKNKKIESLIPLLNNELIPFDKEELVLRLEEIELQFGDIKKFLFFWI